MGMNETNAALSEHDQRTLELADKVRRDKAAYKYGAISGSGKK